MKKWTIVVIIILLLALAALVSYSTYYVQAAKSIQVKDVRVLSIANVTLQGFIIEGEVVLYNPSLMNIDVKRTDISLTLKDTDALLSSGTLEGRTLGPKTEERLPFSQEAKWPGLIGTAIDIIKTNETVIVINGNVHISRYVDVSIPFRKEYDINMQIKDYAAEIIKEKVGGLLDAIL